MDAVLAFDVIDSMDIKIKSATIEPCSNNAANQYQLDIKIQIDSLATGDIYKWQGVKNIDNIISNGGWDNSTNRNNNKEKFGNTLRQILIFKTTCQTITEESNCNWENTDYGWRLKHNVGGNGTEDT